MITLTENAANEIKRRLAATGDTTDRVRIGVEAGGCSGIKYVISPGAAGHTDDLEIVQFGLAVLCDPISLTSIEGLTVDFVDAFVGGGFRYDNPRATGSCGCGASFKVGPETGNIA